MDVKEKLSQVVGTDAFFDDPATLQAYATDYSYTPAGAPNYIVKPGDSEQISQVIKFCNENCIPVVPCSSKVHFYGATIPKEGGVIMDLEKMNNILEIDPDNRRVRFETGVTWEKLTQELKKEGYRVIMPLTPPAQRSALTDFMEREEPTNQVYDYGEPLAAMEVVWPTGEIFRMGSASVNGYPKSHSKGGNPSGPGLDFYRFFQCAQGTMGVVTWTNLKIESIPQIDKVLFAPITDLDYATDFLYRILPRRIGQEVLLLNNVDLAAIIAKDSGNFEKLKASLPPWTLILVVSGLKRRPEEKIAYEENFLAQVIKNEFSDMKLTESLPGFPGLGGKILQILREPWPADKPHWRNQVKGACQMLSFHTRPLHAKRLVAMVEDIASRHDYPIRDIGLYIQPIEHNRACKPEFTFFYDPDNAEEKAAIRALYKEAAVALINEGAVFTRPYGDLAPIVYERATSYASHLKRLKKTFDPNNIMNPGNLCF
ncbi:FAD-binding oxidoreductase [Desulfonema magnum]|uniref:FAD-binding domain-containing protein n=1 Tax=Desulfonema magnum TaxID=45655 RepID=A0A975GMV8_9BACT|nr:FAD-binding oxidoreductase [Desulfonema magnum]QTA87132.1 FAD-binding domain-containing protein [Desulfonema magnum]